MPTPLLLPQNDPAVMNPGVFETYLATPHGTDFAAVAASMGIESREVGDPEQLARLVAAPSEGPRLLQVRTNRHDNLELHRRVIAAVEIALAGSGA